MSLYLLVYAGYMKNCSYFLMGGLELSVIDPVPFFGFSVTKGQGMKFRLCLSQREIHP